MFFFYDGLKASRWSSCLRIVWFGLERGKTAGSVFEGLESGGGSALGRTRSITVRIVKAVCLVDHDEIDFGDQFRRPMFKCFC